MRGSGQVMATEAEDQCTWNDSSKLLPVAFAPAQIRPSDADLAQPMDGLAAPPAALPSSVRSLAVRARPMPDPAGPKGGDFGDQTLSFGPGECLLVSHDLPVCSSITRLRTWRWSSTSTRHAPGALRRGRPVSARQRRARAAQMHRGRPGPARCIASIPGARRLARGCEGARPATVEGDPLSLAGGSVRRNASPSHSPRQQRERHRPRHRPYPRRHPLADRDPRSRPASRNERVVVPQPLQDITSTTPLQYQKELRLLEARRLLRTGGASVTTAAFEVGYESPSQFSREYARKFGRPPKADAAKGSPPWPQGSAGAPG